MSDERSKAEPGPDTLLPGEEGPSEPEMDARKHVDRGREALETDQAPRDPSHAEGGSDEATAEAKEKKEPKEKKAKKKKQKDRKDKEGKGKEARPPRAVETMFRTSYRTHLDLSSLADNKANIMISINGIIISILLASIYPRITENRWLLLPTAVLLITCLVSLVYAVLSARPRVTHGTATLEDVRKDRANILFFGTFASMDVDDFMAGMRELIKDPDRAYGNMIRDIHGLGSVLETKYRLLRASYTVFMMGLIAGVILFLAVFAASTGGNPGF